MGRAGNDKKCPQHWGTQDARASIWGSESLPVILKSESFDHTSKDLILQDASQALNQMPNFANSPLGPHEVRCSLCDNDVTCLHVSFCSSDNCISQPDAMDDVRPGQHFALPGPSQRSENSLGTISAPLCCVLQGGAVSSQNRNEHNCDESDVEMQGLQETQHAPASLEFTEAILQNLTMKCGNPSQRCYANAPFRAWVWTNSFLQLQGNHLPSHAQKVLDEALENPGAVNLPHMAGLKTVWENFDEHVPNDVGAFVNALWKWACSDSFATAWYCKKSNGEIEQQFSFPIHVPYPEDWGNGIILDALISHWANTDNGLMLQAEAKAVVFHVGRDVEGPQGVTKHNLMLEPAGLIHIPVSPEGEEVAKEYFTPVAFVMHHGETHERGHYSTILVYKDLMWLADDGEFPKPLPKLLDTMKQSIVQVWAIPSSALDKRFCTPNFQGMRSESAQMTEETPLLEEPSAKRAKLAQEGNNLHVLFGNVTNLGKDVDEWIWHQTFDVLLLVETHLDQSAMQQKLQHFSIRGIDCFGLPAAPSEKGGTHGGFFVLHQSATLVSQLGSFTKEGCGWIACLVQKFQVELCVVSMYLKCGEGFQGDTNCEILAHLLSFLQNLTVAWVIVGDWNSPPQDLTATVLLQKFRCHVHAPETSTLQGSLLDYAVASTEITGALKLTDRWDVPWKPHCLLDVEISMETCLRPILQLPHFEPVPALQQEAIKWEHFVPHHVEAQVFGLETNQQANDLALWSTATEKYMFQNHDKIRLGRGSILHFVHQPLQPHRSSGIWKKGAPAFWNQLLVRFHAVQKDQVSEAAMKAFWKTCNDAHKFWQDDGHAGSFVDLCWQWLQQYDESLRSSIEQILERQAQLAQQHAMNEGALQYKQWLKKGEEKGLGCFFRTIRANDLPWQRPYRKLAFSSRMSQRLKDWGAIWQPLQERQEPDKYTELLDKAKQQALSLDDIDAVRLAKILKKLPQKACGADAISFDLLRNLPFPAVQQLAKLMRNWEISGQLPTQTLINLVAMLPKNERQERPITLTSCLYRVWCRYRKDLLTAWQNELPASFAYDKARPGFCVLDVALQRLLQTEVAKELGEHTITLLCDMSNFYDKITLKTLPANALEYDYPALPLLFAWQVYSSPRVLTAEGEVSQPQKYAKGISAGCAQAPLLAKVHLAPALQSFATQFPQVHVDSWVDDLSLDVRGSDPKEVAQKAAQAFRTLTTKLQEIDLDMNIRKTAFVCSSKESEKALKEVLQANEPQPKALMRDLGLDTQGTRRRRVHQLRLRMQKAFNRHKHVRRLKIPKVGHRLRLHKGGIHPCAVWGAQAQGMAPRYRTQLRTMMARHFGHQRNGSLDVVFDLHSHEATDPADSVILQHVQAVVHLFQRWPDSLNHVARAWQSTNHRLSVAPVPWLHVKGPMAALIMYFREWGWDMSHLDDWRRPATPFLPAAQICLEWPWWKIQKAVQEECAWQRFARLQKYTFCEDLEGPPDWHVARKMLGQLKGKEKAAFLAWLQGAYSTKVQQEYPLCDECQVPCTVVHAMWMCPKVDKVVSHAILLEWQQSIEHSCDLALWARGMRPKINVRHSTGTYSLQGSGTWADLPDFCVGKDEVVSISTHPTSRDGRLKFWVFSIVLHQLNRPGFERKAAITGIVHGEQTRQRALFYALRTLAFYADNKCQVVLSDKAICQLWASRRGPVKYPDLDANFPADDYDKVRVLYVSNAAMRERHQAHTDFHLLRRQQEAKTVAIARATAEYQEREHKELMEQDQLLTQVYETAVVRMGALLDMQQAQKAQVKAGNPATHFTVKDEKKKLIAQMKFAAATSHGHVWVKQRNGLKCRNCQTQANQRFTLAVLQTKQHEACSERPASVESVEEPMELTTPATKKKNQSFVE